jgi:transcriptional regulator with XRE-family HTH domain
MRRRAGLTQADIAQKLNRSTEWVALMEKGNVPSHELQGYWGE